eukprot:734297-Pleurochrysis_carterae.AAC.4
MAELHATVARTVRARACGRLRNAHRHAARCTRMRLPATAGAIACVLPRSSPVQTSLGNGEFVVRRAACLRSQRTRDKVDIISDRDPQVRTNDRHP